jgi:hypothetical protein
MLSPLGGVSVVAELTLSELLENGKIYANRSLCLKLCLSHYNQLYPQINRNPKTTVLIKETEKNKSK